MHRRKVLKYLAGAAAACPTCLSVASALASEKKAAANGRGAKGAGGAPHWEYQGEAGPENWGQISPGFKACALGFQQSPIDLDSAIVAHVGGIEIDYRTMPLGVVNGPVEISTDQIRQYASIFAMNARPVRGYHRRLLPENL